MAPYAARWRVIAGEAGAEFITLPDGRTMLLTSATPVPPGTRVTSVRKTREILNRRRPRYANGTQLAADAVGSSSSPVTFVYEQNAPVYGVEDLNRHLEQWSRGIAAKISVGRRSDHLHNWATRRHVLPEPVVADRAAARPTRSLADNADNSSIVRGTLSAGDRCRIALNVAFTLPAGSRSSARSPRSCAGCPPTPRRSRATSAISDDDRQRSEHRRHQLHVTRRSTNVYNGTSASGRPTR